MRTTFPSRYELPPKFGLLRSFYNPSTPACSTFSWVQDVNDLHPARITSAWSVQVPLKFTSCFPVSVVIQGDHYASARWTLNGEDFGMLLISIEGLWWSLTLVISAQDSIEAVKIITTSINKIRSWRTSLGWVLQKFLSQAPTHQQNHKHKKVEPPDLLSLEVCSGGRYLHSRRVYAPLAE